MSYAARIRTRSTDMDYHWLGGDPDEWWTTGWGRGLLRLRPCLLREADAAGGKILITGIQSGRHDGSSSHARISYDVTFVPDPQGTADKALVDAVVSAWWNERGTGPAQPWPLGQALDDAMDRAAQNAGVTFDTFVNSNVQDRHGRAMGPLSSETQQELASLAVLDLGGLRSLTQIPKPDVEVNQVEWIGAEHPAVTSLLLGTASIAYFSATSPETIRAGTGVAEGIIVVVDGDAGVHQRPKRAAPDPTPGQSKPQESGKLRRTILLVIAAATGLLVLYFVMKIVLDVRAP